MASGSPCVNSRWDRASGVEAAAAMAAKINAMLMAKGKLKPLQPLPSKAPVSALPLVADELVVAEVDINDVPIDCRNLLTRSRTQEEIAQFSGAAVSTKGLFMSGAEQCSGAGVVRPLYLQVQGRCQEDVNKAVSRIKQIISEDVLRSSGGQTPAVMPTVPVYRQPITAGMPTVPVYRQPITAAAPLTPATRAAGAPVIPAHKPAPPHSGSFVHTKIFVGLDQSQPSFSVNERVEGPSGSYLQHIQSESGARVFLRGRGSGYIEQASRRESFEPLYLYISHPNAAGLEAAKKLCENLLDTVRADHTRFMTAFPSTGSVPVYPTHGYSVNNSYGSQSWCSYPSNGYSSSYPTYWSTGSGAPGQSQMSSGAHDQSQMSSGAHDQSQMSSGAHDQSQMSSGATGQSQMSSGAPDQSQMSSGATGPSQMSSGATGQSQVRSGATGQSQMSSGAPGQSQMSSGAPSQSQMSSGAPGQSQMSSGATGQSQMSSGATGQSQMSSGATGQSQMSSGATGQSQMSSGATGQSQMSSGATSQSQNGAVQYPVRQQSAFLLPEASDRADGGSSPKQHTAEEEQKTQICTDVPVKAASAVEDCRTLMPPPAAPIRKRLREEEPSSRTLTHTAAEQKKLKTPGDSGCCSGLVPYGGDSSDEEEERVHGGSKSAA